MKIISRKLRKLGTTLVETLPPIGMAGFLATTLLPALSKAKAKANRVKCANNLKTIGMAWNGFATTQGEYPWMTIWREAEGVYRNRPRGNSGEKWQAKEPWRWAMDIEMMWMPASDDLRTIRSLLSPCDPGSATMVNDTLLKEAVQEHREAKASWIFPLEVFSQPHQAVRN